MGLGDEVHDRKPNKREKAKQARGRRAQAAGSIDWVSFEWAAVQALTEQLVEVGGAVRLGATRDGGAWAFGIYVGDDYATEYIRPAEQFAEAVGEICEAWLGKATAAKWYDRLIELRAAAAR